VVAARSAGSRGRVTSDVGEQRLSSVKQGLVPSAIAFSTLWMSATTWSSPTWPIQSSNSGIIARSEPTDMAAALPDGGQLAPWQVQGTYRGVCETLPGGGDLVGAQEQTLRAQSRCRSRGAPCIKEGVPRNRP